MSQLSSSETPVLDLLATGHRQRLTDALECTLSRLDDLTKAAP